MRDNSPLYGGNLHCARMKAERDLLRAEDEMREAWGALAIARMRIRVAAQGVLHAAIHCGDLALRAAQEGR